MGFADVDAAACLRSSKLRRLAELGLGLPYAAICLRALMSLISAQQEQVYKVMIGSGVLS